MKNPVKTFLEKLAWLPTFSAMENYSRLHDDHDGECIGTIVVTFGRDGDAWVSIPDSRQGLRFRTYGGGGRSIYTRMALMVLAEAIRLDNEENPQNRTRT